MMFSKDDFVVSDPEELVEYLPIFVLIGLIAPFLIAAYTLGFVMDKMKLLD